MFSPFLPTAPTPGGYVFVSIIYCQQMMPEDDFYSTCRNRPQCMCSTKFCKKGSLYLSPIWSQRVSIFRNTLCSNILWRKNFLIKKLYVEIRFWIGVCSLIELFEPRRKYSLYFLSICDINAVICYFKMLNWKFIQPHFFPAENHAIFPVFLKIEQLRL